MLQEDEKNLKKVTEGMARALSLSKVHFVGEFTCDVDMSCVHLQNGPFAIPSQSLARVAAPLKTISD